MSTSDEALFTTTPGFCPDCGSILPLVLVKGKVTCYTCTRKWGTEVFGDMKMTYTVVFNNENSYSTTKFDSNDDEADGPIIDRQCPNCNNDKMFYATLQLRSADEGQTIFYTCTKCKHKETENS